MPSLRQDLVETVTSHCVRNNLPATRGNIFAWLQTSKDAAWICHEHGLSSTDPAALAAVCDVKQLVSNVQSRTSRVRKRHGLLVPPHRSVP